MRAIIVFIFIVQLATIKAQNLLLWNGEIPDIYSCQLDYGTLDSLDVFDGNYSFNAEPDMWHSPGINLNCQNTWRSDISGYDELWFYTKANLLGHSFRFYMNGWPYTSKKVDVTPYIQGGILDTTYQLVRIPIDSLKNGAFELQNVENVLFDTSSVTNFQFKIDKVIAMDLSPIHAESIDILSNQALKISVSDRYDTTDVQSFTNYYITSTDDSDFSIQQNPSKVGKHYYVYDFADNGAYPKIRNELFLYFDQKMKNGKTYTLSILNIKDRANNDFASVQDFTFVYNDEININHSVKVNQVGYLPVSPKLAYIGNYLGGAGPMECSPLIFEIRDQATDQTMYSGVPNFQAYDPLSGEKVYECDFGNFQTPGKYYLYVPEIGRSYNFGIDTTIYDHVFYTTARGLFYQRCGMELAVPFADPRFVHGACHTSDVIVHSSCAGNPSYDNEPIGSGLHMTGGWHDAGDFGRYIPSAATVLYDIFSAYERYPQKFFDDELNIPESGNGVPDILDEAKWEVDWFKEMQAPDGGVYFKVNPTEWPTTMPEFNNDTLFLAQKTTYSTAMYAAIMSMAYRNFQPFFPDYADTCLVRAERAWDFLMEHLGEDPVGSYAVNAPGIGGGQMGDGDGDLDERAWAAAELYKSTGDPMYDSLFAIYWVTHPAYWGWNSFQHHQINASYAYATTTFPTDSNKINDYLNGLFVTIDFNLIAQNDSNYYQNAYRSDVLGWIGWGSFAQSTRYSKDFIIAHYFTGDPKYLDYAKINLNTQLGANPQDMCYITGVGSNYPKDPAHGTSLRDSVDEPVPGIPVYGPMSHLSFSNGYDAETQRATNLYPKGEQETDPYPILRRFYDNHENIAMNEFDVDVMGYIAMVYGYFKSGTHKTVTEFDPFAGLNATPVKNNQFQLTNYPNPFGDITTFCYVLNNTEKVTLQLFDVNHKQIALLIDNSVTQGRHSISYDTSNLSPGIYFCEMSTCNGKQVIKVVKY